MGSAYDTNNQVIQDFASSLNFERIYIANAEIGIDALAGAPLASMTKSPIVLTNGVNVPAAATFAYNKTTTECVVTVLGGTAVVPPSVLDEVDTGKVTTVSAMNGTITVTLSSPSFLGINSLFNPSSSLLLARSTIANYAVTASGIAVTPTAISSGCTIVTLKVPTVSTTANDQPGVYSVSYRGEIPVVGSIEVTYV